MPTHDNVNDEQLMRMIGAGNRLAFETLYERYFNKLVWYAQRFVGDVQKAEDTVQEVFVKIIEKPGLFNDDKKFSTWVYTVTGNACRNMLRNEQNRARLLNENLGAGITNDGNVVAEIDRRLLKQGINEMFESLSAKEKEIYVLRFDQGLGISEVAVIMGIPEGSVKSGIYYLLKKFALQLKDFKHEN